MTSWKKRDGAWYAASGRNVATVVKRGNDYALRTFTASGRVLLGRFDSLAKAKAAGSVMLKGLAPDTSKTKPKRKTAKKKTAKRSTKRTAKKKGK